MWTRFLPAIEKVQETIASGDIGTIVSVQGDFGWKNIDCPYPQHRIWSPNSGGMTMDIGMYMAQFGQVAYSQQQFEIERIQAMATRKHNIDQTVLVNIMYSKYHKEEEEKKNDKDDDADMEDGNSSRNGDGDSDEGMLQFYITGAANTDERVTIQGSKGRIVIDPPAHVPTRIRVIRDSGRQHEKMIPDEVTNTIAGSSEMRQAIFDYPLPDDSYTDWNYPGSIGLTYEVKAICEAIRNGKTECHQFTGNNSIQLASILDEILRQINGRKSENHC